MLFSQKLIVVSKPRCGSTSLRRMLDAMMDKSRGDMAVDLAGQHPPYHPHLSAPYLKQLLRNDGHDVSDMTTILVTRHPVQMLWSYFKFFQPDARSQYNFSARYDPSTRMDFQDWVMTGRVGMNAGVKSLVPQWVSERDLSPLSLEAHADNKDGSREVDFVFRIEDPDALVDWLRQRTARPVHMLKLNMSAGDSSAPELDADALNKIRSMFPEESRMYVI